jgi:hypothetical protein
MIKNIEVNRAEINKNAKIKSWQVLNKATVILLFCEIFLVLDSGWQL